MLSEEFQDQVLMEGYKQFVVKAFTIVVMALLAFIGSTQGQPICCFREACCCQTCSHPPHVHNWNLQKHINCMSEVWITYEVYE